MYRDPSLSYRHASALGATPIGQVVLLYDTILRDLFRALAAMQAGEVETRVLELNHALTVIAHLQSVLDFERGGEAATQLDRFYKVTRGLIMKANFQPSPAALEELINLYGGLREAWTQAERNLPADHVQAPPTDLPGAEAAPAAKPPTYDDRDTHRSQWSG